MHHMLRSGALAAVLGVHLGIVKADPAVPPALLRNSVPTTAAAEAEGPAPADSSLNPERRQRQVRLAARDLASARYRIDLFPDTRLVAERERIVVQGRRQTVWAGHLENEPHSEVILAMRRGVLSGMLRRENGELFRIDYAGKGRHRVRQLDPDRVPAHSHPLRAAAAGSRRPAAAALAPDNPAPLSVVDLMVVYTPAAKARAGGATAIRAKIDGAVAAANQAYLNSGIDMQLRLVHAAEVAYTESGDMQRTLKDLRGSIDGKMDAVHQWRNQFGADQVALVSTDANYCGIAYQMSGTSSSFAAYAFAVVHDDSRYACLANQTLAHELGHNQGNAHDRASSSIPGVFPYSYGHRVCQSGGFRTIMAYPCSGATRVSYFANPSLTWNGQALGIDPDIDPARSAADAWSMETIRTTVAGWRKAVVSASGAMKTAAGEIPQSLAAEATGPDRILLHWPDLGGDEAGYRIERSLDLADWREIANLPAGTAEFLDTGLAPETRYHYRVSSYNGNGGSEPGAPAAAETAKAAAPLARDEVPPSVRIEQPGPGAGVGERLGIVATARDDGGIGSLKLYIDGRLRAAGGGDSLTYSWNAEAARPGTHTIEVLATDASGNTGRASVELRK
jgi:hypothetical protein